MLICNRTASPCKGTQTNTKTTATGMSLSPSDYSFAHCVQVQSSHNPLLRLMAYAYYVRSECPCNSQKIKNDFCHVIKKNTLQRGCFGASLIKAGSIWSWDSPCWEIEKSYHLAFVMKAISWNRHLRAKYKAGRSTKAIHRASNLAINVNLL